MSKFIPHDQPISSCGSSMKTIELLPILFSLQVFVQLLKPLIMVPNTKMEDRVWRMSRGRQFIFTNLAVSWYQRETVQHVIEEFIVQRVDQDAGEQHPASTELLVENNEASILLCLVRIVIVALLVKTRIRD